MKDDGFSLWRKAGNTILKVFFGGDSMMAVDQQRVKYKLPQTDFLCSVQVKGFILNQTKGKISFGNFHN